MCVGRVLWYPRILRAGIVWAWICEEWFCVAFVVVLGNANGLGLNGSVPVTEGVRLGVERMARA